MGVIYSSLLHCWLKHSRAGFILGLTQPNRDPSCLITLIITLSFIIFFCCCCCCSPLPTAEYKHPNQSTHKSRQLLRRWPGSRRHIFKDSISVALSPLQARRQKAETLNVSSTPLGHLFKITTKTLYPKPTHLKFLFSSDTITSTRQLELA